MFGSLRKAGRWMVLAAIPRPAIAIVLLVDIERLAGISRTKTGGYRVHTGGPPDKRDKKRPSSGESRLVSSSTHRFAVEVKDCYRRAVYRVSSQRHLERTAIPGPL